MFNRSTMQVICELDVSHIIGPWTKKYLKTGGLKKVTPKLKVTPISESFLNARLSRNLYGTKYNVKYNY